jgi:hypothetical protein
MNDPAMLDSPTASGADAHSLSALEGRVHRLEEAVAALQDTHLIEERIVEKLRGEALHGGPQAKVGPLPPDSDKVSATPPSPAPPPPEMPVWNPQTVPPRLSGLAEFRAMVRMFFDIHYHVAWTTRILTLVIVGLIATSHWWFPPSYVPAIGFIFEKTIDIILAFLLYRVLGNEARRYVQQRAQRRDY